MVFIVVVIFFFFFEGEAAGLSINFFYLILNGTFFFFLISQRLKENPFTLLSFLFLVITPCTEESLDSHRIEEVKRGMREKDGIPNH